MMVIFVFTSSQIFFAQPLDLSKDSLISLLTCSPGKNLYSLYGHCAIRIKDSNQNLDKVYNYGVFDFNMPNFYGNFIKGRLLYLLDAESFSAFRYVYQRQNRSIIEQILNLPLSYRQRLFQYLETNLLPQNKQYLYHYFFNNCATKIRDALINTLPPSHTLHFPQQVKNKTFRQLIDPYVSKYPWLDLGLDIVLGFPCDHKAKPQEFMFLPDHLMKAFAKAQLVSHGKQAPLVKDTRFIFQAQPYPKQPTFIFKPVFLFTALLCLALWLTYREFANKKRPLLWFDRIIFTILGLIGLFLCFLWFCTDHTSTSNNFNLLWAIPFHCVMIFLVRNKKPTIFIKRYFLITSILQWLLLISWPFHLQQLNPDLIPLILLIAIRSQMIPARQSSRFQSMRDKLNRSSN